MNIQTPKQQAWANSYTKFVDAHTKARLGWTLTPEELKIVEAKILSDYRKEKARKERARKVRKTPAVATISKWHEEYLALGMDKKMPFANFKKRKMKSWKR